MRRTTPQSGERPSSRQATAATASSRMRASTSALPRAPQFTRIASFRASTQATGNTLAGVNSNRRPSSQRSPSQAESTRPSSRDSIKENLAPPDADEYEKYRREIESLKAEIGTLQYRMQTADSEKEIALSQQNNKVEQARRREQDESQKRQIAEAAQSRLEAQLEEMRSELDGLKDGSEQSTKDMERKYRAAQNEASLAQEELQDMMIARDDAERISKKKLTDLETQLSALQRATKDYDHDSHARDEIIQQTQAQVAERDSQIANLEADVLRLKAQAGDADTMLAIKRELSEQVQHIRALESTNRDQLSELKHLRSVNKAVEVVEEEKRTLQRRVEAAELLEAELAEARLQRQRLEDERRSWASYLESSTGFEGVKFDSPEAMARALAEERYTTANYVDQVGALRGEINALQNTIQSNEQERKGLQEELANAKASVTASSADKTRMRLERQKALALKEVEYLRAQLKAFDTEDQTMQPEQFDEVRVSRVQELEALVDNYKSELETVHAQLSSTEPAPVTPTTPQPLAGSKRSHASNDNSEQLGQLTRKNRSLQEELASLQTKLAMQEKELSVSREQLTVAKSRGQTRVLSLRSNPTADHEAIKRATLEALRKENKDLLATLKSKHGKATTVAYIPTSVLGAMEREIAAAKAETASAQKSARRLKEVWGSKSHEFKEAIFSTLGWTVTFIPNGKMRVESTFYPSKTDEHENSIVFDGERGTMKVGGGPKSQFAQRIADQIGFWVREKGCIPGFLAALTLEFYEEHNSNKEQQQQ
ncbi:M protein repeat protein [Cordyceps fumosorosea ARSEF 2679]|uniref:Spindle assembly checkpoint component MAD1 n=1 Tax=Cordyceps fumosorosea (strain ARSEF 2679) TaxID=1081104 RepID=A0A167RL03_CORFA|nr:M protein repeat protein [Cordyceps fumosorosea ARSEF 2679]OAA58697.1 M protein repeat protein [Cordyceps fumosorosea ARSEF 2679]